MEEQTQQNENHHEPKRMGRPTIYTEELGMQIAERIMFGESLRKICADAGMPDKSTLCRWLARPSEYTEFYKQYRVAREVQADFMSDEILEIADGVVLSETETGARPNLAIIHQAKLKIDARKWVASHFMPKRKNDSQLMEELEYLRKKPYEFIIQKNYNGVAPGGNKGAESPSGDSTITEAAGHSAMTTHGKGAESPSGDSTRTGETVNEGYPVAHFQTESELKFLETNMQPEFTVIPVVPEPQPVQDAGPRVIVQTGQPRTVAWPSHWDHDSYGRYGPRGSSRNRY